MVNVLKDMMKSKVMIVVVISILGFSYLTTTKIEISKNSSLMENNTNLTIE